MPARSRVRSCGVTLLGLACGVPCSVAAQKRLELVAYVGRYRPTSTERWEVTVFKRRHVFGRKVTTPRIAATPKMVAALLSIGPSERQNAC